MKSAGKRDVKWVSRGLLSASECFACANKVNHRLRGIRVSILCRDPCNYRPLEGERHPALDDIEELSESPKFVRQPHGLRSR